MTWFTETDLDINSKHKQYLTPVNESFLIQFLCLSTAQRIV